MKKKSKNQRIKKLLFYAVVYYTYIYNIIQDRIYAKVVTVELIRCYIRKLLLLKDIFDQFLF